MQKLSTGQDSTLGNWLDLSKVFFGAESAAVRFLERKIAESPNGEAEEIIANEGQLLQVLAGLVRDEERKDGDNR